MLETYNILRRIFIVDGSEQAYAYIQTIQSKFNVELTPSKDLFEILLTNFYSYVTLQSDFNSNSTLDLLQQCLTHPLLQSSPNQEIKIHEDQLIVQPISLRALTNYHIGSIYFLRQEYSACLDINDQIIQECLFQFYMLEKRLQRKDWEERTKQELQQILYYSFLMKAYCCKKLARQSQSEISLLAGRRLMKNHILTLTKKDRFGQETQYSSNLSPHISNKQSTY